MLNSLRRAVTIVVAAAVFSTVIPPLAVLGTTLIIGGSIAFSLAPKKAAAGADLGDRSSIELQEKESLSPKVEAL